MDGIPLYTFQVAQSTFQVMDTFGWNFPLKMDTCPKIDPDYPLKMNEMDTFHLRVAGGQQKQPKKEREKCLDGDRAYLFGENTAYGPRDI